MVVGASGPQDARSDMKAINNETEYLFGCGAMIVLQYSMFNFRKQLRYKEQQL